MLTLKYKCVAGVPNNAKRASAATQQARGSGVVPPPGDEGECRRATQAGTLGGCVPGETQRQGPQRLHHIIQVCCPYHSLLHFFLCVSKVECCVGFLSFAMR